MSEEVFSLKLCTISLHNSINIHEDVLNFNAKDCFWCGAFEIAAKKGIGRPTNKKKLEKRMLNPRNKENFLNQKQ